MPQRNVATNFTFEQQRQEINLLAADFTSLESTVNTAAPTYLKHDGSNDFTGQTLNVPNAFTINANSGSGTLTISGNLDVTGTTTTVNTANLEVTDKNILHDHMHMFIITVEKIKYFTSFSVLRTNADVLILLSPSFLTSQNVLILQTLACLKFGHHLWTTP